MCSPSLAMMGLMAVVSAGQVYMGNESQNKMVEAQAESANVAANYNMQQLAERRREVDEQAAQEKWQRQLQTMREHSTLMVAAGEAGVGGNSVLRVMNNAFVQGSYDKSVIEANRLSNARQINAEMDSVHAKAQSQLNEAEAASIDPTMGALNIGLAAVKGGAEGYMMGDSLFGGKTMGTDLKLQTAYHGH